jgi:hypothetical protein
MVANRLKPLLKNIISKEQGGFVEGRQILDGIVVSHETIHSMKKSRKEGMLIKLDMSKAYDRISWHFLRKMLEAFIFAEDWVRWILGLVSSSFFSILINGSPSKNFNPTRGIRQGDPLSPYLYIILVEGLGRLIQKEVAENKLQG